MFVCKALIFISLIINIICIPPSQDNTPINSDHISHMRNELLLWNNNMLTKHNSYQMILKFNDFNMERCLTASIYIKVINNKINDIYLSKSNNQDTLNACENYEINPTHYDTINDLFDVLINFAENGESNTNDYKILNLEFNKKHHYPQRCTLYNKNINQHIQWEIQCFEPDLETKYCQNPNMNKFFLSKKVQEIVGWCIIVIVICSCGMGSCISCMKNKKSRKLSKYYTKLLKRRKKNIKKKVDKHGTKYQAVAQSDMSSATDINDDDDDDEQSNNNNILNNNNNDNRI